MQPCRKDTNSQIYCARQPGERWCHNHVIDQKGYGMRVARKPRVVFDVRISGRGSLLGCEWLQRPGSRVFSNHFLGTDSPSE